MARVLVFAGAGASYAVNPDRYPTTLEFQQKVDPEFDDILKALCRTDPKLYDATDEDRSRASTTYQILKQTIRDRDEPFDVERVIAEAEALEKSSKTILKEVEYPPISSFIEVKSKAFGQEGSKTDLERNIEVVDMIRKALYSQVFRFYGTEPELSELTDYIRFFNGIGQARLDVFTTNYDLVLDSVVSHVDFFGSTVKQDRIGYSFLDLPTLQEMLTKDQSVLIKIHGSVNWQEHNGQVIVAGPPDTSAIGDIDRRPLIYPGEKKCPDREPFKTYYKYLEKAVKEADVVVFIGYAFRDEALNKILAPIHPHTPKYVVCKGNEPENIPFVKETSERMIPDYEYIRDGFDNKTVDHLVEEIQKHVKSVDYTRSEVR